MFMKDFPYCTTKREIVSTCKRLCKVNIKPFLKKGFDRRQLMTIATALYNDIPVNDVFHFANMNFDYDQLQEIFKGLKDKVDVSKYAKKEFDNWQMHEIRIGLINGLDVSVYAKAEYSDSYMHEIRLAMETNTHEKLLKFINAGNYTGKQLHEIRLGLEIGLDVSEYANAAYPAELMKVFREDLEKGIKPEAYVKYFDEGFTPEQIAVIRDGLIAEVDVNYYAHTTTTPEHMRDILNRLINMKK